MKTLKITLIWLGLSALTILLFMFCIFDLDYELNLTQEYFLKNEYNEAKSALQKLAHAIEPTEYALYLSYIAAGEENTRERNDQLKLATQGDLTPKSLLEIHLNKALISYLEFNAAEFKEALHQLNKDFPDHEWTRVLNQIASQFDGDYKESASINAIPAFLNPWMERLFRENFNSNWLKYLKMQNEINQGGYLAIRKELVQFQLNGVLRAQERFLLGFTYLKEAMNKPTASAPLYIEMAFEEFKKMPLILTQYHRERHDVVMYLVRYANQLHRQDQQIIDYLTWLEAFDEIEQLVP